MCTYVLFCLTIIRINSCKITKIYRLDQTNQSNFAILYSICHQFATVALNIWSTMSLKIWVTSSSCTADNWSFES